ncbi:hypothetical protein JZ751_000215, partial [Albula glossodonta]
MSVELGLMEVEQVVVGEGIETPVDLASDSTGDPYKPPAPTIKQSYQHDNLQCFQCFITFCNSKAKERHMKKSHREEYKQQLQQTDTLFTCYVCDRTFPSSEELTEHQATHSKEDKPFKCPHCSESFRTFTEVTSHRRQVCPEKVYTCRECKETFKGVYPLRVHRATCHPQPPERDSGDDESKTHRCGKCGRGFEAEAELLQHQENHAGDQYCNGNAPLKRRGRPPKVADPANGEKKEKQIKTEEGNQIEAEAPAAAAKGQVKGRRGRPPKSAQKADPVPGQADTEEKEEVGPVPQPRQHPCPECEASFPNVAQLRAHKKEKHGRPPPPRKAHACKECEESFAKPEQLEAHTTRVHGVGRHSCPTCGKSFSRENSLKAHQQTHTNTEEAADG